MPNHAIAQKHLADLRQRAAERLAAASEAKAPTVMATNALAVLHSLASTPDTAPDALTLLHELQVHQVELELQAEELRESRIELESALRRKTELYDTLPVGCFTVDRSLVVHELNQTGAGLLGIGCEEAVGLPLDGLLGANGARVLRALMSRIVDGRPGAASSLPLIAKGAPEREVRAYVSADPSGQRFMVVLAHADE